MPGHRLKNELVGLRGTRLYTSLKASVSRFVGRSFWYDHLASSIDLAMETHKARNRPLNYYEFGTGSGNTLQRALSVLKGFPESKIFLFDSFEGLPEMKDERDANVWWGKGEYAFSEGYIRGIIKKNGFSLSRVRFTKGFFKESLTQELQREVSAFPPAFITIDVDYCSSTKTVLDFLKPLLSSGSIVYFDDLWAFDGHPEYGQLKALSEFNEENKDGQLVPHQVLGNRMYSYYRNNYEFLKDMR